MLPAFQASRCQAFRPEDRIYNLGQFDLKTWKTISKQGGFAGKNSKRGKAIND